MILYILISQVRFFHTPFIICTILTANWHESNNGCVTQKKDMDIKKLGMSHFSLYLLKSHCWRIKQLKQQNYVDRKLQNARL